MKNGKVPTRNQRTIIEESGRKASNWLVVKDTPVELEIVSRNNIAKGSSKTVTIKK